MKVRYHCRTSSQSQKGSVLFIFLIFALPLLMAAYIGLVVTPGIQLLKSRIDQHRQDKYALTLRYECQENFDCPKSEDQESSSNAPSWPEPVAISENSIINRYVLTLLQVASMSKVVYAADAKCEPPECIRGQVYKNVEKGGCNERNLDPDKIYVTVKGAGGSNRCATATIVAEEGGEPGPGVPTTNYLDGIVGCEEVVVDNGGYIGATNGANAFVYTTDADAEIKVEGGSRVVGDVESSGKLTLKSVITGELYSRGDMEIKAGSSAGHGNPKNQGWENVFSGGKLVFKPGEQVYGNVIVGGNEAKFESGGAVNIGNDLFVYGDLLVEKQMDVGGGVKVGNDFEIKWGGKLDVVNGLEYGGTCEEPDWFDAPVCASATSVELTLEGFDYRAMRACDPIGLSGVLDKYSEASESVGDLKFDKKNNKHWLMSSSRLDYCNKDKEDCVKQHDVEGGYLKVDDFLLSGGSVFLTLSGGDFILYVDGDFEISGNSTLHIEDESTLLLLVKGDVKLKSSGNITTDLDSLVNDGGLVQLSIFSGGNVSFEGGNKTLRALIYAPDGDVEIKNSRRVVGAVRGKKVKISGSGEIIYEPLLSGVGLVGGGGGSGTGGDGAVSGKPYLVE